ncbi:MAG: aldo/keto reductase [Oscillospiraceae bacterium]|jgi:predicted aldo/keto reductase-like oxidoreductase|nr:aldo/keto reductase [Oscillospiraceae bacterium]
MEYRELGKTGKKVSVIGLGCEHLDRKPYEQIKETIDAALEYDVNILDVFMPGKEIRENVAKALGNRRDKVMIQGHIGASDVNQQYDISRDMPTVKKYFEDLLRIYGGYIDFGMLFFIDTEENYNDVFETDFAKYAEHLKKQGDIGHIGFSSHNPEMAIRAINTGIPEMLMFSVNPAFDMLPSSEYVFDHFEKGFGNDLFKGIDPKRAELYKLCEQKQIGITVMKTFGVGKLMSKEHTPFSEPMTVPQCISYALSRPAVACILPGCQTGAEVQDTMNYFNTSDAQRDYSQILSSGKNDFKGSCVYCNHCQPCPVQIDVAAVMKLLDIARLDKENIPPTIKAHYRNLAHKGDECTNCGHCEKRCPFEVPIIQNMSDASMLL